MGCSSARSSLPLCFTLKESPNTDSAIIAMSPSNENQITTSGERSHCKETKKRIMSQYTSLEDRSRKNHCNVERTKSNNTQDFGHIVEESDISLSSAEESETSMGMHEKNDNGHEIKKNRLDMKYPVNDISIPSQVKNGCYENTSIASEKSLQLVRKNLNNHGGAILVGQEYVKPVITNKASSTPKACSSRTGKARKSTEQSTGRWTTKEHEAFIVGLKLYGREWKKVARSIPTRTSAQIRSHAQKYFSKIARNQQQQAITLSPSRLTGMNTIIPRDNNLNTVSERPKLSPSMLERFETILQNPEAAQCQVKDTLCRLRHRYMELQQTIEQRQRVEQARNTCDTNLSYPSVGPRKDGKCNHDYSNHLTPLRPKIFERKIMEPKEPITDPRKNLSHVIDTDETSLVNKELIALNVLGGTLCQGRSEESFHKISSGIGTVNAHKRTEAETSSELIEPFSSGTEKNNPTKMTNRGTGYADQCN